MGTEGTIQGCLSTCTINHALLPLNCKKSITNAEEISAKQIRTVDGGTHIYHFQVQSQSKKTWYDAWFGSGNTMPKCSWLDLRKTGLPCKHFFAAFQHYPQWQLEAFPEKYRKKPKLKAWSHKCLPWPNNIKRGHWPNRWFWWEPVTWRSTCRKNN